ncbi:cysteine-rich receptor-like protein kinase 29 [Neltuma alba]|uniref:cysteine-rich receptor-like protein kinase 29 n=1 Tax=Neltuma alba TaxID=207710 RepID=UPI0010A3A10A|nr:cysteine-rich receptor-like protein kinase 29 [Prosopis alba]
MTCSFLLEATTKDDDETKPAKILQIDYNTIKLATDNFSDANKLGQGGFGPVYKGRLPDGQEVAMKMLSRHSRQGDLEFKTKQAFLNWIVRYKIIRGIARGLLYLHQDSILHIIHRDLKASNILLDDELNPKISNFGTARLFKADQTRSNTNRIVATSGYMAPEYVLYGQCSVKSDVYSFGVLVLEIISGKKNSCTFHVENTQHHLDLLSFVWKNWKEGTTSNIVDPVISNGSRNEIMRCIHIALLCIQENTADQPTMASVSFMLNSFSSSLPVPSKRRFLVNYSSSSEMMTLRHNSLEATRASERGRNSNQSS